MKRQRVFLNSLWLCAVIVQLLWPLQVAQAKYIGAEPPKQGCSCGCSTCGVPSIAQRSNTSSTNSESEGNLTETVRISRLHGAAGPTAELTATYNTYNADGSRATVDTVMGYGWTHSYNIFLFGQFGALFRYDGDGRVTRYRLGPGGTFITATGYFETLVKIGANFILTKKDQTTYTFASIPGTPFLVGGSPVYRLTQIKDRNGNTTTFTYTTGNLTSVSDTYGRTLTFSYSPQHKLTSVTDPAGRLTTFQYDSTNHLLTTITDPNGKSIQYTYNTLYQLTSKMDKAGRTFTYSYSNFEPVAVNDSNNTTPGTLSNPNNWATDSTQLAMNQLRVYLPSTTTNTDGRGNAWKYQYDSNGYLTQAIAPDGATTTYTYDPSTLQLASIADANSHTTSYQYDSFGDLTQMTDALGHVTTYTYESTFHMMTSMTDPRGRTTTYTIDPANGNRTKETDPLGNSRTWTYNSNGNVTQAIDKDGNVTKYQYDSFGNLIQETDAFGTPVQSITQYGYDPVGNRTSMTDALGRIAQYQYDGLDRLTQETDAVGTAQQRTTQFFYDGEGNRTKVVDPRALTSTYQYDVRQRLTSMTEALSSPQQRTTQYSYDANDNRASVTDPLLRVTTYQYDTRNRLTQEIDATGTSVQATTQTSYDAVGNVISQTDANGHTTNYTYDQLNRRSTMTDAAGEKTQYFYDTGTFTGPITLGGVTVNCVQCGARPGSSLVTEQIDPDGSAGVHTGVAYFKYDALDRLVISERKVGSPADTINLGVDAVTLYSYDPVGNRLSLTEPDGNTTTDQYDAKNRLFQETNAAGDVTVTAYDAVNNVITVTAPNGNITNNSYDSLNRVIQVTDSIGLVAISTYDPDNNRISQGDGNGNITSYTFDALNRVVTTTDPLGKTTTSLYDAVNNLLSTTDRNGNATSYTYDALNRRSTMTDALGNTTTWQYDLVGNLTRLSDANLHATQYIYDAVNRPQQETYADGLSRSYTYDAVGNILTRTDQIGQVTNYAYNDLYFLTGRSYPSAVNDTFTYDLSGRMLTGQRGTWPVTFAYDGANRVTQTAQNGHTISYGYNIPGRTRQVTYPGSRVITEHTDARTRMDHIDDAGSPPPIVQYAYDVGNRVTSRNYRNGTSAAYSYNANDWITNLQHSSGGGPIAGFNYAYDNEGNKQFENKLQDSTHSECYGYDTTYRLISYKVGSLVLSCVPAPTTQTAYNLDPVGNWNSKTTNAVTQTRVHNSTNELVQINATTLTYDANGNLLNDGTYTYAYDEENRLTKATRNSDSAGVGQYQYDALSRRVQKIANPAGTPTTTQYFYDNARIIEEQNTGGTTQATYVYGNYIDEILTMARGGQTYYYHPNALWSVEAITDQTATPVERYSYDAYGLVAVTDGTGTPIPPNPWGTPHSAIGSPWMFTGRQLDEEVGLYFYRARSYDPQKGRFLQRDPLEYVDGVNLYEYVGDNPSSVVDPLGTVWVRSWIDWRALLDQRIDLQIRRLGAPLFLVRHRALEDLVKLSRDDATALQVYFSVLNAQEDSMTEPTLDEQKAVEQILGANPHWQLDRFRRGENVDQLLLQLGQRGQAVGLRDSPQQEAEKKLVELFNKVAVEAPCGRHARFLLCGLRQLAEKGPDAFTKQGAKNVLKTLTTDCVRRRGDLQKRLVQLGVPANLVYTGILDDLLTEACKLKPGPGECEEFIYK